MQEVVANVDLAPRRVVFDDRFQRLRIDLGRKFEPADLFGRVRKRQFADVDSGRDDLLADPPRLLRRADLMRGEPHGDRSA